jgi:purine-binding chemotaxis protein CheW
MESSSGPQNSAMSQATYHDAKTKHRKFMFLKLGRAVFAVPLAAVREVIALSQLSALPNMPAYFAGLMNLRGKIVSAIHLRKSLVFIENIDESSEGKRRPCVIITEINGQLYGAIVDDVIDVQAIHETDLDHSIDRPRNQETFDGMIKRQGAELAPVLNLKRALRIEELVSLVG